MVGKVKDLLTDASKWTQGAFARDAAGNRCWWDSDEAVQYCLLGALRRVYSGADLHAATSEVRQVIHELYPDLDRPYAIDSWNDDPDRTFEEVREVIEKADV